jgi:hypothetical protein
METYGLRSEVAGIVAARLHEAFGSPPTAERGSTLARDGFEWRYHQKAEPERVIRFMTDQGTMTVGELALLLYRARLAPVDRYFNFARRRVYGFERSFQTASTPGAKYHLYGYYKPEMVTLMTEILRFYHNWMLPEDAAELPSGQRPQTPAMKLGLAKGLIYPRDLLGFV